MSSKMDHITAEDIPELQIPHKRWKRLVTREDYENEKFAINLQRLNYEALRMRPHFVVLGEARNSGEVHSLLSQLQDTIHMSCKRSAYARRT